MAVLMALLLFPLIATAAQSLCGPDDAPGFETAEFHRGVGTVALTDDRTLELALKTAQQNAEIILLRVGFYPGAVPEADDRFPQRGQEHSITVLDRRDTFYREVEVFFDGEDDATLTFFVDQRDCVMSKEQLRGYLEHGVYPVAAISNRSLPENIDFQSAQVRDFLGFPLILSEAEISAKVNQGSSSPLFIGPLWCQSGGQNSLSCAINLGGLGSVNLGGCDITCVPPAYACCGQGVIGASCSCVTPSGGGAGGGGGFLPPWWPWPGGGDDGDDDSPGDDDQY